MFLKNFKTSQRRHIEGPIEEFLFAKCAQQDGAAATF
jgi:hypothetical protein